LKFLEERSFHLEQFLKKIYKVKYLLVSPEFSVFARDTSGNVLEAGQRLEQMAKQNTAMMAYRIKQCVSLDEDNNENASKSLAS